MNKYKVSRELIEKDTLEMIVFAEVSGGSIDEILKLQVSSQVLLISSSLLLSWMCVF